VWKNSAIEKSAPLITIQGAASNTGNDFFARAIELKE